MREESERGVMDLHPSMCRAVGSSGAGPGSAEVATTFPCLQSYTGLLQGDAELVTQTLCTAHEEIIKYY